MYTRQSSEQLARLREYAMVESAVSSNRIEGIEDSGKFRTKDCEIIQTYPDCLVCEGRGVAARWLKIKNIQQEE